MSKSDQFCKDEYLFSLKKMIDKNCFGVGVILVQNLKSSLNTKVAAKNLTQNTYILLLSSRMIE